MLEQLIARHPWPQRPPDVPVDLGPAWFLDDDAIGHTHVLKDLVGPQTRILLELGSFVGRSTACFLRLCPNAHVIAVDTWRGSPEYGAIPEVQTLLPKLYETFQSNLWRERERLTAIRATTVEGMQIVHACGVVPDVVYVDADHQTASVIEDLTWVRRLFPDAQVIGDDWRWPSVRAAVEAKAREWGATIAVWNNVWWLVDDRADAAPGARARRRQKVVTITAYRRPEYTRRVIEALRDCHGVDDYLVLFHVEPGCREVVELARSAPFANKMVVTNAALLGCTANTYSALDHAFRFADFVVYLEDDTVPARDCLRYFEWARETYRHDRQVFSVTSYCRGTPNPDRHHAVQRWPWFNGWGVGTWFDRWVELADRWGFDEHDSWDMCVNRIRGNRVQIQPYLARTQNIGAEQGTYCPGPAWHRENQFNAFGAWSVALDPSTPFREERNAASS